MKRIATALIGIPIVLLLVFRAPDWLLALAVAGVAALSFNELLALGAARTGSRPGLWVVAAGALVTFSFLGGSSWVAVTLPAAALLSMAVIALGKPMESLLPRMAAAALGIVYCCLLPGFLILLERGEFALLLGIVWAGDSLAYYGGRTLGRHPLAPEISPKKTLEGAVAGLVGSAAAGAGLGAWLLGGSVLALLGTALLTGAAGQVGDLAESALKRSAGMKDSSALLPGHGGALDRVDSLLFAAPVFYWLLRL